MTDEQAEIKTFLEAEEVLGESRVAKVLAIIWDRENDDAFLWSINGCHQCDQPLIEGAEGYVWGKPVNDHPDCTMAVMLSYCSDPCINAALEQWADELGQDVYAGYYAL